MSDITPDSLQIARLEERMSAMHRDMLNHQKCLSDTLLQMTRLSTEVSELSGDMKQAMAKAAGGWKVLMWLGCAATSVAGLVVYVANHITFKQ